jgi:hypothetical protein
LGVFLVNVIVRYFLSLSTKGKEEEKKKTEQLVPKIAECFQRLSSKKISINPLSQ